MSSFFGGVAPSYNPGSGPDTNAAGQLVLGPTNATSERIPGPLIIGSADPGTTQLVRINGGIKVGGQQVPGPTFQGLFGDTGGVDMNFYPGNAGSLALSLKADGARSVQSGGRIYPSTDALALQLACGLLAGNGIPANANGNNGDIYFRGDGAAGTMIYQRRAGAWVASGA